MSDRDDLEMQIAEYVLGTLPADERDALSARRQSDPALDALILEWEERLSGLADAVEPVQPGPEVFASIERALDRDDSNVIALRLRLGKNMVVRFIMFAVSHIIGKHHLTPSIDARTL
jgi:anti-sigma-K factor RskA